MMYAKGNEFIKDFAARTKANYECLKAHPYEVTQLINSAIGLLIIPQQMQYEKIADSMISDELLRKLLASVKTNTYKKTPDLPQIARHLRNSIAHAKFKFNAQQQSPREGSLLIHSVVFTDKNRKTGEQIEIEIAIDLLEEFFYAFSDAVSNLEK